jgi:hypothetical protein
MSGSGTVAGSMSVLAVVPASDAAAKVHGDKDGKGDGYGETHDTMRAIDRTFARHDFAKQVYPANVVITAMRERCLEVPYAGSTDGHHKADGKKYGRALEDAGLLADLLDRCGKLGDLPLLLVQNNGYSGTAICKKIRWFSRFLKTQPDQDWRRWEGRATDQMIIVKDFKTRSFMYYAIESGDRRTDFPQKGRVWKPEQRCDMDHVSPAWPPMTERSREGDDPFVMDAIRRIAHRYAMVKKHGPAILAEAQAAEAMLNADANRILRDQIRESAAQRASGLALSDKILQHILRDVTPPATAPPALLPAAPAPPALLPSQTPGADAKHGNGSLLPAITRAVDGLPKPDVGALATAARAELAPIAASARADTDAAIRARNGDIARLMREAARLQNRIEHLRVENKFDVASLAVLDPFVKLESFKFAFDATLTTKGPQPRTVTLSQLVMMPAEQCKAVWAVLDDPLRSLLAQGYARNSRDHRSSFKCASARDVVHWFASGGTSQDPNRYGDVDE